ncbi:Hypothetical Protein MfeM64YM_0417 [Mycoplasmopsis fermentans M64]|uniref:Uncharacterized protein n=1 Tax=Mycoplasmopsis fermentans (strain M64) TaxID=943945 RepID=A0AB32XBH2_MYCFM|nr:Hypothetical Protein MfeM64YM_0417 [Mycoplasmopsis fermentans M64]
MFILIIKWKKIRKNAKIFDFLAIFLVKNKKYLFLANFFELIAL